MLSSHLKLTSRTPTAFKEVNSNLKKYNRKKTLKNRQTRHIFQSIKKSVCLVFSQWDMEDSLTKAVISELGRINFS